MMAKFPGLTKYKAIVISTALFVGFVVGVLFLNYLLVRGVESEVGRLQLSKELQSLLNRAVFTQERVQQAPNAEWALRLEQDFRAIADEIESQFNQLTHAARVVLVNRHSLSLGSAPAKTVPPLVAAVKKSWDVWLQAHIQERAGLSPLAFSDPSHAQDLTLASAALLGEVATQLTQKSDQLRMLQLAAMTMTLMIFFGILVQMALQLHRRDEDLEAARVETDNIMNTVTEGLFLLDAQYNVGLQQSSALQTMFGVDHELEGNFLDFVGSMVPANTLEIAKDFLELLFGERVKEKLIGDLNPLTEVEISLEQRDGSFRTKFLCFEFRRVYEKNKLSNLLVSVTDVTRETVLARELDEAREQHEAQFDLLMNILHVDSGQLGQFIEHTTQSLDNINEILKAKGHDHSECLQKLEGIYRFVHRIKGDAASLDLHVFEVPAHAFEAQIEVLQKNTHLTGKDLLSLAMQLKDLFSLIDSVRKMVSKFASVKDAAFGESSASTDNPYVQLGHRTAQRLGKQVMVTVSGIAPDSLPEVYRQTVHDATIQLVRNAVVHGLENSQERAASGKSTLGNVAVSLCELDAQGYELVVRDDGRGLSKDDILRAAQERSLVPDRSSDDLSGRDILKLIFHPGFSTRLVPDEDAGRGVGLDAVKDAITQLGGRIHVGCAAGHHCEFRVRLPAIQPASEAAPIMLQSTA